MDVLAQYIRLQVTQAVPDDAKVAKGFSVNTIG